jgi:AsmA protein
MKPGPRRLLRILAAVAALFVLLLLALPFLVPLDAVRARVVAAAEAALHRKVEIGAMRLQIFSGPGAGVEKVAVRNPEGWESPALLSADAVSIKVAFWPLLSRRVEVRRIVLDGVTLAVERSPSGALNIDDFLSAGSRDSAPASQTAAAAFLVSRIEIARGRAIFVDRKIAPGRTITTSVDDLTGRIVDVSPSTPARFDLAARFLAESGRNLTLQGDFGPLPSGPVGQAPLKASFGAKDLALGRLAPYVAAFAASDPGKFSISGTAEGAPLGVLAIAGKFALVPAAPASRIPPADGTFAAALDWGRGTLALTNTLISAANLPLRIEGRLDGLRKEPRVDLRIATPGEVSIDSVTGLPGIAGTLPSGMKLAGRIRFEAQIRGAASDLETEASVDAAPFAVTSDGKPLLGAASTRATLASRGKGPMSGRITAPAGNVRNVPFEKLAADWTWNEGSLTLSPSATVYGGTLSARVESDFAHPNSDAHLSLDVRGVEAKPLLESATSLRDVFSGRIEGKLAIASRGLGWEAISKTGRGDGRLSVADADLRTVQLMPEVARSLSAVGKVAGFQVPASLESTKFSALETSLRLADGRVATPDLKLSGRDVAATADGSIGLDRTISYQGRIVLGPAIVKSLGGAGRYVADSEGKLALPFHASGPISSPKVAIDESIVLDLGRRVLARQAGERLGGTAGQVLGNALEGGDGRGANPVDLLQQFLKPPAVTPTPRPR